MSTRTCPSCQAVIDDRNKFCPECGAPRSTQPEANTVATTPAVATCDRCGEPLEPGDRHCPNCGHTQEASSTIVAAKPRPTSPTPPTPAVISPPQPKIQSVAPTPPPAPVARAASNEGAPLYPLIVGGTLALGVIGAFALPVLSYQNPYYGSGDLSLMNAFREIGKEDGFAAWPFVLSAVALGLALFGILVRANAPDLGKRMIVCGSFFALAVPVYLWNELNKIASELEDAGTLADLGSGMIVFAGCMLVAIVLGLFGSQFDDALHGR